MVEKLEREQLALMIRRATEEVFTTMLGVTVRADESYLEQAPPAQFDGVVSFIGMAGAWAGTGSLCCSSKFACSLSSSFLMTEFAVVDEQVLDAIGELTNMIIGNVKNEVEEHLGPMGLSIPTVIHGSNFCARSLGRDAWTVVPFWAGEDRLDVKMCLTPKDGAGQDHGTAQAHSFSLRH
jgi:chemotaxis protein CheX